MPWLIAILIIVSLFFVGVGMKQGFGTSKSLAQVTAQKISGSSRSEIEAMLKQIEAKAAPAEKMGAMCYEMARAPDYQEYVCPLDGQKSIYRRDKQEENAAYNALSYLDSFRRMVERLNSLTTLASFKLDEKRLCHTCSSDLKPEQRYINLIIEYPDGTRYSHEKVDYHDLELLIGFFEKGLSYKTSTDGAIPLKGETRRIRQILGLELETDKLEEHSK